MHLTHDSLHNRRFLLPSSHASRSCRAWRKMPRSPLSAHKAPVMQAKPMILGVQTHTPPRFSSFDEVERPVHFRNFSAGHVCHPNHVFFAIIFTIKPIYRGMWVYYCCFCCFCCDTDLPTFYLTWSL